MVVAVSAAAALSYLARAFPGEPRIYFAATLRCGRLKIPSSDTKLKDKYFFPVWSTLCAPISPTLPPSKKSLGNPERLFLRVHEIKKA